MKKLNTNKQSIIQRLLERSPRGGAWMRMFFMLILIMTSSASVMAQMKYGIWIAGVEVTSANSADLSVIDGVSGKVSFSPFEKTLTLENATIEAGGTAIHNKDWDGLIIAVVGTCKISSLKHEGISIKKSTRIYSGNGEGKLIVKAENAGGIVMENAPLEIRFCKVEVDGKNWGIAGYGKDTEELTICKSEVTADIRIDDDECGTIADIGNLVLEGSSIAHPSDAAFDATLKGVAQHGEVIKDKVVIVPSENYGIKIAGVDVNPANCVDLSVIDGVEGKLSYNPETNTLTMEDCTIKAPYDRAGIWIEGQNNVRINVLGNNSITAVESVCIGIVKTSTISGSGILKLKSDNESALLLRYPLTIEGIKLYVKGRWGIAGYREQTTGSILTIRKAYVEATGELNGSICDIENLNFDGSYITQPAGAVFDAGLHAVAKDGKVFKGKVVIAPPLKNYGISVAGVEVTKMNCKNLSVIKGVEGKLSYDPDTKTLTMEDCTINTTNNNGIRIEGQDNIKINVIGNNSITTVESACILTEKSSTISGSGTLRLKSGNDRGIYFTSPLTIEGVKLYMEGSKYGIAGFDGQSYEVLTLRNAYVEATGSAGSIRHIENLNLKDCLITQPEGAAFDANLHAVAKDGKVVTDKVVIAPIENYGIKISSVKVTSANCKDLSFIDGVEGKLSYDPDTKTLTMEDCSIELNWNNTEIIKITKDINIMLLGKNRMVVYEEGVKGINVESCNTTISGSGSLSLSTNYLGMYLHDSHITINGTKLDIEATTGAIYGFGSSEITIRNSHVEANLIQGLNNLVLEGCSITQPTGAAFDATLKGVALNGYLVKDKVVIEPDASGINGITADVPARKKGIFTVLGVKLTQQWNELPAGVYIVDGVTRVKR